MDRSELPERGGELAAFGPDALIDCRALSRQDARTTRGAVPDGIRLVVLSSMDVYRAFGSLLVGEVTDAVPLDESAPVRSNRFPYRGRGPEFEDYEKLDVEEEYLERGGVVCRLPMVYGERDYQTREEFVLRRVRAGRRRIPFGPGSWLTCLGYVGEVARAVRLAMETEQAGGQVFNVAQRTTWQVRLWAERILEAVGWEAELVRVPAEVLPEDLGVTKGHGQHLLADTAKAAHILGWVHDDPEPCLRRSVEWHLANPPEDADADFSSDDIALEAAVSAEA
jgi:nucleoside-diphosphate-sugar epimerase